MTVALPASWSVDGPVGAPVVVLGNSLGTGTAMWDAQLPFLLERFRVIRYDHPGHGGSVPPTTQPTSVADLAAPVLALLDHLGVARASLVGVSLGGMVGMWIAAHHPDRVDRLVLICTAAHLPPAGAWTSRGTAVRAEGTAPLLPALLGRWFTAGYVDAHPEVADSVATMLAAADAGSYAACCDVIGGMDQRADLPAVTAPTLVLAGAEDPVVTPAAALELATAIPGAALVVLPGAAHLAAIEQAEAVADAVIAHLLGTERRRGDATRRAVLGDAHVDAAAGATGFTGPWLDLITRFAWGDVWTRPGLDRRARSMITLAALTALGRHEELALHVAAARRNGLTDEQIAEVLLHTAVYAGVPAANAAFAIAARVLAAPPEDGDRAG